VQPAEQVLELKVGAKVMMIRNDPDRRWVNSGGRSVQYRHQL